MDFTPSTNLKILRNVPLDNTYKDTLTFNSEQEQFLFFSGKVKVSFNDFTFIRLNSSIRVKTTPNTLYDCNYIMFQNENFGSKWFYAFIKEINYLNPETSEIVFELDIMQSWYFNYEIKQCFVEREHVNDDSVGLHTVPENLETGAYITTAESNLVAEDLGVYVLATEVLPDLVSQQIFEEPAIVGGMVNPCYLGKLGRISSFTPSQIKSITDSYAEAGKSDAIVAMFTAPWNMVSTQESVRVQTLLLAPRTTHYTPKNNKLLSYPYCSLALCANGQATELKYELFGDNNPAVVIRGGFGANMQVTATPKNYEGQTENIQNSVTLSGFPVMAWTSNYYQNWLAQNKASTFVSTIKSTIMLGAGVLTAIATAPVGGVLAGGAMTVGGLASAGAGISQITGLLSNDYEHSIIPDKMTGSATASDINAVSGKTGFYSFCRTIRAEYAKIIDDFFTMYGYKVNALKVPNIHGRKSWNYVKTVDCVVIGSIPVEAIRKIKTILNAGITFWHGDYVGDYSRDNSIV